MGASLAKAEPVAIEIGDLRDDCGAAACAALMDVDRPFTAVLTTGSVPFQANADF